MSVFVLRSSLCVFLAMSVASGLVLWLQPHYMVAALMGGVAVPIGIAVGAVWSNKDLS